MLRYLLFLLPALAWAQNPPVTAAVVNGTQAFTVGAAPNLATWVVISGNAPPPYGSVLAFMDHNLANTVEWTNINCGTMVGTPGVEQGDCDVLFNVDGKQVNISFAGRWAGNPPGLMVWPPDLLYIGSLSNRWAGLFMTTVACPAGIPGAPKGCIRVNGGFAPFY